MIQIVSQAYTYRKMMLTVFKPFQRKEICLLDKLTKGGIALENVSDKLAFTATIVKL